MPMDVIFTVEPGSWCVGLVWEHKYRILWVLLPMLCWEIRFRMS